MVHSSDLDERTYRKIVRRLVTSDSPRSSLGDVDRLIAAQQPGLLRAATTERWLVGTGMGLQFAAVGGLTAFLGPNPDYPSTDALSPEMIRVVVPLCMGLAAIGVVWALIVWLTSGRPHDWWEILSTAVALGSGAGVAFAWNAMEPMSTHGITSVHAASAFVAIGGFVSVVLQAFWNSGLSLAEIDAQRVAGAIRTLPETGQQVLRAQRNAALNKLAEDDVITRATAERAIASDWGDLGAMATTRRREGRAR